MPPTFTAHVKTDKGFLLREHESIEQAQADADKSNALAKELGVKVTYEAVPEVHVKA